MRLAKQTLLEHARRQRLTAPLAWPGRGQCGLGYVADALRCQRLSGAQVVAAAGDDGSANANQYPAAEGVDSLVSIAASNASKHLAGVSNFASRIGLAAPGDAITSSLPGWRWGTCGGASMTAPLVAGSAAFLLARKPALAALTNTVPPSRSCR